MDKKKTLNSLEHFVTKRIRLAAARLRRNGGSEQNSDYSVVQCARSKKNEQGFAILAALFFVLLIGAAATSLAQTSRQGGLVAAALNQNQEAELALGGFLRVLSEQLKFRTPGKTALDGLQDNIACRLDDWTILFSIQDHAGLIDLNKANQSLIEVGFRTLGFQSASAQDLAALTIRSRTALAIFEAGHEGSDRATSLKHAPFESVGEIADLVGNQKVALEDIAGVFTIYNSDAAINIAIAPKALREMIEGARNPDLGIWLTNQGGSSHVTVKAMIYRHGRAYLKEIMVLDLLAATRNTGRLATYHVNAEGEPITMPPVYQSCFDILEINKQVSHVAGN